MRRICVCALLVSAFSVPAWADPLQIIPDTYNTSQQPNAVAPSRSPATVVAQNYSYSDQRQDNYGGGFIEFLFSGPRQQAPGPYQPDSRTHQQDQPGYETTSPQQPGAGRYEDRQSYAPSSNGDMAHPAVDPKFDRQVVSYDGKEEPGTVIIDTPRKFLYLVEDNGKAMRYGIGVGKPGFTWSGVKTISAKREWPDWRPPTEMLQRRPDLPRYMAGGPDNPLGARAMYLGSTLYRIHGSNEPWTIGTNVSSGCIRLRNEDVIDLYQRVKVGTKVVVI
jgi:lipoprotein-anchoring transpeptidase ErfK/SrfK